MPARSLRLQPHLVTPDHSKVPSVTLVLFLRNTHFFDHAGSARKDAAGRMPCFMRALGMRSRF